MEASLVFFLLYVSSLFPSQPAPRLQYNLQSSDDSKPHMAGFVNPVDKHVKSSLTFFMFPIEPS